MIHAPLAQRLRPTSLDAIIGQQHLVGPDGSIRRVLANDQSPSMILWGPPGCGKTTLALAIGAATHAAFHSISAVLSGIDELRKLIARITAEQQGLFTQRHLLFIDEIHRWNKAQQDALLPHVEAGTITLIGATTENPSFEIIAPLLSRCTVYCLDAHVPADLQRIATRAFEAMHRTATDDGLARLAQLADGDARRVINLVELAVSLSPERAHHDDTLPLDSAAIDRAAAHQPLRYDKTGEEHYNLISAFIKSMRGSDPDAAVYYLARMYEAGEDPRFIARRMVIFASEDITNADPHALPLAIAVFQAFEIVGQAEGWIPLAQAATYLASAPKANASYIAYKAAKADVQRLGALPTPLHLRNAPTQLMKDLHYGRDYKYPHSEPAAEQTYLPTALLGQRYYTPPWKK